MEAKQQPRERPILFKTEMVRAILQGRKTMTRRVVKKQHEWWRDIEPLNREELAKHVVGAAPFKIGDLLWVRETWRNNPETALQYRADDAEDGEDGPWKPSIFMPKRWARLWLNVTNVRAEWLQDITEYEIAAEGLRRGEGGFTAWIQLWDSINAKRGYSWDSNPYVYVVEFERYWPEAEKR